jgi:hypothetical protein
MFWKNILPPYTGLKSTGRPSKQPVRSILLNPEDGGNTFLQNVSELLPDYMMVYPRRYNVSQSATTVRTSNPGFILKVIQIKHLEYSTVFVDWIHLVVRILVKEIYICIFSSFQQFKLVI